jgi:phosphoglycerate dehydrogenase-like enzyme
MNRPHVAILDPFHPAIIETIRNLLPDGWDLSIATAPTAEARAIAMAGADVALIMAARIDENLLRQSPRLRFIQKMGAGVDNIDLDACQTSGITVARLGAGNAIQVAEHAAMMILAASRRLIAFDTRVRNGHWDKEPARGVNQHIHGKTVGIIGFGAIGRRLARILTGFEVEVLYNDLIPAPGEIERALGVRGVSFEELIGTAEIITLHLPLTPKSKGMIGAAQIAVMKQDTVLVNCARGGIVDEAALAAALRDGKLLGAGLDVFTSEPPDSSPLFELETAVFSPHCAGATLNNFATIAARAVANAEAYLEGQALPVADLVIDPRALPDAL